MHLSPDFSTAAYGVAWRHLGFLSCFLGLPVLVGVIVIRKGRHVIFPGHQPLCPTPHPIEI